MKAFWREICSAILIAGLLPGLLLNLSAMLLRGSAQELPEVETTAPEERQTTVPIHLRRDDGTQQEMDMEDYLTGVLLGEVPADFEPEALKAQAVAARTYTAKVLATGGKHADGSLCEDHTCCQAYYSPDRYLESGGTRENLEKIRTAVTDTAGLVLTYEGELIEATYFSCSGGSTEDAAAVWGTDYPYLRAVPSPGEETSSHYRETVRFGAGTFQTKLGKLLPGDPASWFGEVSLTPGGGVAAMRIGDETYTGTRLRKLLNLPSTAFTVAVEEGEIVFTTRGYGHRVGMSQYGADAMAATGSTFDEILLHYYPGTELVRLS